MAVCWDVILR